MDTNRTLPDKIAISSSGKQPSGTAGQFSFSATIANINGCDLLKFEIQPGASLITNQETMSYMDGGLKTSAGVGTGGIFGALLRGVTGSSVLQNTVVNPTSNVLSLVLSPFLQSAIVQVNIKAGERWRFADRSFMACTPNLKVSGNVNVFSNFRLAFAGQGVTYTTVTADQDGIVWISAHGACEYHEIQMGSQGTPLFINNGCFLGMLDNDGAIDYWKDYVSVGTPNSIMSAVFTQLGFVMKIQDTVPPKRSARCLVLTQSLNPHNLEHFVRDIAKQVVEQHMRGGGKEKEKEKEKTKTKTKTRKAERK